MFLISANRILILKYKLFILTLPLLLTACGSTPVIDEDSPYSEIPVGSILKLKHAISLSAKAFGLRLNKGGKPDASISRDEKATVCFLELRERLKSRLIIHPTKFQVTRTDRKEEYVLLGPVKVANDDGGGADGPFVETYITLIYLRSQDYPNVRNIRCELRIDYDGFRRPASVTLIRWAIGGDFDIVVARD